MAAEGEARPEVVWMAWGEGKEAGKHEVIVLRLGSERSASRAAGDEEPSVPRGTGLRKLE
jgi:hypothetical protein